MMKKSHLSESIQPTLSQDLTRKLVIMVLVIFSFTSVISLWMYSAESEKSYLSKHSEYLLYLNNNLELPLWNVNREWIGSICGSFTKNDVVSLLRVYDEFGAPLFEMVKENEPSLIVTKEPIKYRGELVGEVELGLTKRLYQKQNQQMLLRSLLPMLFVIIGLMMASRIIFSRSLQTPLDHLLMRIEEISAGKYTEENKSFHHFEMATILEKFNSMADTISRRENSLIETNRKLESEILERQEAENARQESDRRYQQLVEELPVGVFRSSTDYEGNYIMVNSAFANMLGYASKEELQGTQVIKNYLEPNMRRVVLNMIFQEETVQGLEIEFVKNNGQQLPGLITARVIRDQENNPIYLEGIVEDVSERNYFEKQIRQSQKMEAIGTLAGGIAHDFNNILASMFSFTEAAKMRYSAGQNVQKYFDEILDAGLRARSLIKQMLAFSQQSEVERRPVLIGPVLKETIKFLRASLPAMIEIRKDFKVSDSSVLADPTQIHQILMNLCTNAVHALSDKGGVLTIELDEIDLKMGQQLGYADVSPGEYVKLDVIDNGSGIKKEVIDRIFEPFFTTKNRGEGSGMGLSVVHGIVSEMDGTISVISEPGVRTAFSVLLPKIEGDDFANMRRDIHPGQGGSGTILFVDDEEGFIATGKEILERLGYDVATALSGQEAIVLFSADPLTYDIVITDLAMPKMTGFELAKKLKEIRDTIPIILCTGFSAGINKKSKDLTGFSDIIMKPILAKELTDAIQKGLQKTNM